MATCIFKVHVLDQNGNEQESILFNNLSVIYKGQKERSELETIYCKILKLDKLNPGMFTKDELGQPDLHDVLSKTNLVENIDIDKLQENISQDPKYPVNIEKNATPENLSMLQETADIFNIYSPFRNIFTMNVSLNENKKYVLSLDRNASIYTNNNLDKEKAERQKIDSTLSTLNNKINKGNWISELKNKIFSRTGDINSIYPELISGLKNTIAFIQNQSSTLQREFSDLLFYMRKETVNGGIEENPYINRLIRHIGQKKVWFYNVLMNESVPSVSDEDLMDAIKKSLYFHITGNDMGIESDEDFYKSYTELLDKFIDWIKGQNDNDAVFNQNDIVKINNLDNNIRENLTAYSTIYDAPKVDLSSVEINENDKLFTSDPEIMKKILFNEAKKLNIMKKSHYNESDIQAQDYRLQKLEMYLNEGKINEGITYYINYLVKKRAEISKMLKNTNENMKSNVKARELRNIKKEIDSIEFITKDIISYYTKKKGEGFSKEIALDLLTSRGFIDSLKSSYILQAKPIILSFLKEGMGDAIVVPYGEKMGQKLTIDEILEKADKDIGFVEMYIDSVANSSDDLLRILDHKTKQARHAGRQETLEILHKIKDAAYKLEKAGVNGTAWMISKINKEKFISRYDEEKHDAEQREFMNFISEKYIDEIKSGNMVNYETDLVNWKKSHPITNYVTDEYKALSPAQKEYFHTFMEIKEKLDRYIGNTDFSRRIFIRKDFLERVKGVSSFKDLKDEVVKTLGDSFKYRLDDDDFGTSTVISYDGKKEVEFLPIYFTHLDKNVSIDDISTDTTSALVSYAAMATDFKSMLSVINEMELIRDVVTDPYEGRLIPEMVGGNYVTEKIGELSKKLNKANSNFEKLLNEFYSSQLYGRYFRDTKTFGDSNISKQKSASNLAALTSIQKLGLNLLAGISNVITGSVMMRIESIAGQFFKFKDVAWADKLYLSEMNGVLGDIGHRQITSKLGLFSEKFDVLQKFKEDTRDIDWDNKSIFRKLFNTNSLFFINNVGEHWMQNRTALAIAHNYKLKLNGKEINLWDAYDVQFTDKSDKRAGAKLVLKQGVTKENGEKFTENDVFEITRKIAGVNHRLHGIYNKEDMSAFQRLGIGRLVMQFRKWMPASIDRRFSKLRYDYELQEWTEGYYWTTYNFIRKMIKDIHEGGIAYAIENKNLSDAEKANLKRTAVEVAHFALCIIAVSALFDDDDDDDDDDGYIKSMVEYQTRRLYTELGSMMPTPAIFTEFFRILKSPMASISVLEQTANLLNIFKPSSWTEEFEAGRHSGEIKGKIYILKSPFGMFYTNIDNALDPESSIPFYK